MATDKYIFSGVCKWAMLSKPDEKFEPAYKLNLYLDEDNKAQYNATGLKGAIRTDEDGEYVVFKRKVSVGSRTYGPPEVMDAEGNPVEGFIGNGSKVTVKVEVYDAPRYGVKGHRILGVRVDELIKYEPDGEAAGAAVDGGGETHAPKGVLPF